MDNGNITSLLTAFIAVSIVGCASITGSKQQPVLVVTHHNGQQVDNVACVLSNDKGVWFVNAPASTTIRKSSSDLTVTCKKDNFPTGITLVTSSANGGVWGNILFGGIIGYAIDTSSGVAFDYPAILNVQLGQVVDLKSTYSPPPTE